MSCQADDWLHHGMRIAGLALALWLLARVPGVPYNVIKLLPADAAGLLAALGLALAMWWIAALPVVTMVLAPPAAVLVLPLWLLLHGLVTFTALRLTVALPMLHKVIGSPVLAWPGSAEDVARFLALDFALLLPLCGAAALVQVLRRPQALARLLYWLLLVATVAWPLHWIIVEQAATDNLTELMRNGGSLGASSLLALSILAVGTAAGAVANLDFDVRHRHRCLLTLLVSSAVVAPAALLAGLEPSVIKYDRVFSALQFMLSSSRDTYADGPELVSRYLLAWAVVTGTLAWLQAPWWQGPSSGRR